MTAAGWLALAAAVLLVAGPRVADVRVAGLSGAGRLVPRAPRRRGWSTSVSWRVVGGVAVPVAVAGAVVAGGVLVGVAAAAVVGAAAVLVRDAVRGRRELARRADLLAALGVLVAELDAGSRPGSALTAAARAGPRHGLVFDAAAAAADRGDEAGSVLIADADTRVLGLAWRLGERTGAPLAGVLARVAADLAAADDQRRATAVALAGPRSSGAVLTGLPVLGLGLGTAMGARPVQFLVGSPAGQVVGCAGVLLDVAGVLWLRRLLRRAAAP